MRNKKISRLLLSVTDQLVGKLVDVTLFTFFLMGESVGQTGSRGVYKAFQATDKMLADINYESIKQAVSKLIKDGLTEKKSGSTGSGIILTKLGEERLKRSFPYYRKERPWDHLLYLVSYDIPTKYNRLRDHLRLILKNHGAGLVQDSLWINPLLEEFSKTYSPEKVILVSKLDQSGVVGGAKLADLVKDIYGLDDLDRRYRDFINRYGNGKYISKMKVALDYLAILKDDPQLPFPLEPENYSGKEAHRLYQSLL